ncbi:MAG TPA: hypothetical protein VMU24_04170 [Candidatus Acidoferrales bacterium]|nr:hypothetical protein [Candidatus Acidoferrales bacterium]
MQSLIEVAFAILLLAASAFGQQPQICPVRVFNAEYSGKTFYVEFENESEKKLAAWKFNVNLLDPFNDPHPLPMEFGGVVKTKPLKKQTVQYSDPSLAIMRDKDYRPQIIVTKIKFEDGTVLQDLAKVPGCIYTYRKRP